MVYCVFDLIIHVCLNYQPYRIPLYDQHSKIGVNETYFLSKPKYLRYPLYASYWYNKILKMSIM